MTYKKYTITPEFGGFAFQHPEYDGAPESYFSESEQESSNDPRAGWCETLVEVYAEIDGIENEVRI